MGDWWPCQNSRNVRSSKAGLRCTRENVRDAGGALAVGPVAGTTPAVVAVLGPHRLADQVAGPALTDLGEDLLVGRPAVVGVDEQRHGGPQGQLVAGRRGGAGDRGQVVVQVHGELMRPERQQRRGQFVEEAGPECGPVDAWAIPHEVHELLHGARYWQSHDGRRSARREPLGHPHRPPLRRRSAARGVPLHAGPLRLDVPAQAVDDADVRRVRLGGGHQRPVPPAAGCWRHGPVDGLRHAHAHGSRLR